MIPAEDGRIGAWLVAGPVPRQAIGSVAPDSAIVSNGGSIKGVSCCRFQPLSSGTGSLDLVAQLGTKTLSGSGALVAGIVKVDRELAAWLLLNVDGAVSVWLDGKERWRRDTARLRSQSWDVIALDLPAGEHSLVFWLQQRGTPWAFEARLLDRATLQVPSQLRLRLPGTNDSDANLFAAQMLEFDLSAGLADAGYRPTLTATFPNGMPESTELSVEVNLRRTNGSTFSDEKYPIDCARQFVHGVEPLGAKLREIPTSALNADGPTPLYANVRVGSTRRQLRFFLSRRTVEVANRARKVWAKLRTHAYPRLRAARVVEATLDYQLRALEKASAASGDTGWQDANVTQISTALNDFVAAIERGEDPLFEKTGILNLAFYSNLDGNPTGLRLWVPREANANRRRYPLTVALHGYNGSPRSILDAFFYAPDGPSPDIGGFVVAPEAFGNAFYRGAAEANVIEILDWVENNYPIDRDRVSITGVSMGGTGTAQIALRYPERFAAVAPLCGYHTYFDRRDLKERSIRPWEENLLAHWSTMSWAENAIHLPFHVAQGTLDLPLENSKSLVRRLDSLAYDVTSDWPIIGHDVWRIAYRNGEMWNWLTQFSRQASASPFRIKTDALRYAERQWGKIVAFRQSGQMAELSVNRVNDHQLSVMTNNVDAFELSREGTGVAAKPLSVIADGTVIAFEGNEPIRLARNNAGWQKTELRYAKHAGVEGPIHDAFLEPLVFSYGTLDPKLTRANREVTSFLAKTTGDVSYPIVPDSALDAATIASHSLVLVGNAESHALLHKLAPSLPMKLMGGELRLGKARFTGNDLGAIFVYPNPLAPTHYVVVVLAATAGGIWRALSLPKLLPDFMVYDDGIANAAGQQVLATGYARAAGYFSNQWQPPERICDPLAPVGRCDDVH